MTPPVFAHGHLRLYLLSLLAHRADARVRTHPGAGDPVRRHLHPERRHDLPAAREARGRGPRRPRRPTAARPSTRSRMPGGPSWTRRQSELDDIESDVTDSVRRLADEVRSSVDSAMRSLRADLAASAREARRDAQAGRSRRTCTQRRARGEQRAIAGGRDGAQGLPAPGARGSAHAGGARAGLRSTVTLLRTNLSTLRKRMLGAASTADPSQGGQYEQTASPQRAVIRTTRTPANIDTGSNRCSVAPRD